MTEEKKKKIFRFECDESCKLVEGIRKTEATLRDLPPEKEWAAMFPKGPTLEEARTTLESNRKELFEKIEKKAEKVRELEPRSIYPASPPRRKGKLTRNLKGIFSDFSCTPSPPEQIFIPPTSIANDTGSIPSGNGGAVVYDRNPPSEYNFMITVQDNNDPFNSDVTETWLYASYVYDLPSRPFPARFDLEIHGGIALEITSRSNNIYGSRWWRGWVNGGLGLEGEEYVIPNASLPIYGTKAWNADDWSFSANHRFERSVVLDANQSIISELAYILTIRIDRGLATGLGWYWASAPYVEGTPPDLRCIITPEY